MKPLRHALCLCFALSAASAAPLKFCHEEVEVYPWRKGQNEGLDHYLLQTVAQRLKLHFEYKQLPWKRCQYEVRYGLSDGMFGASFTNERQAYASYPLLPDGQPDKAHRLARDQYRVYRRLNTPMNWQDGRFTQVQVVGTQAGYSIIERLRPTGLKIDSSSLSAGELLRKLEAGFIDVAITLQGEAGQVLKQMPALAQAIEILPQPYHVTEMYLALNRELCQRDPGLCQALWREIRAVRESRDYLRKQHQHGY